jgi:SAM-dependent methyltransferase
MKTKELVNILKENDCDNEFYPTTDEILNCIINNLNKRYNSILDVGCGNGVSLQKLGLRLGARDCKLLGIEITSALRGVCSKEITIIGVNFFNMEFDRRNFDLVFCNPPYSWKDGDKQYESWATKLLVECDCSDLVMVIPRKWSKSSIIREIMQKRNITANVIGSFNFLKAERSARVEVDVIRFTGLRQEEQDYVSRLLKEKLAGRKILDSHFKYNYKYNNIEKKIDCTDKCGELLTGEDYVNRLVKLYKIERDKLTKLIDALADIPDEVFGELEADFNKLLNIVKDKYEEIDNRYWDEVIARFSPLTQRLISSERDKLLKQVRELGLDFNVDNIYFAVETCIKAVNLNIDNQVLEVYNQIIDDCNVEEYKSNARFFRDDNTERKDKGYKLKCRIIKSKGWYYWESGYSFEIQGNERCYNFIKDLIVIANNLGYNCKYGEACSLAGSHCLYHYDISEDGECKKYVELVKYRIFKNNNVHLQFEKGFMNKLNVIKGRLEGWLHTKEEVMEEFGVSEIEAVKMLDMSEKIVPSQFRLGCDL